jgi:predicted nucleic acid-binding Zn ribbon protein
LKEVIQYLLKSYGLERKLDEQHIRAKWAELVGPMINRYTSSLKIKGDVLFVEISSPVVRNELSYAREKLLQSLNESVGKTILKKIVIK